MAENFKRRFSFRHLSFRKAKRQPIRPRSSIDVTDSKTELKRSASVRPASLSRERLGGSSARRDVTKRASVAGKPIRPRSSIDVTDSSRTELKRLAPLRPASSLRERSGASNVKRDATDSSRTELKRLAPLRPASSYREGSGASNDSSRTELKRLAPLRPESSYREGSGASNDSSRTELKRLAPLRPASSSRNGSGASNEGRGDVTKRSSSADWNDVWNKPTIGQALHSFEAILRCDLTFEAGDQILILTRTSEQFDWWEGTVRGQTGIFPANFIQVLD